MGIRGDIQGLRAVAILFVFFFHSGLPVNGGFTGVDIFFVISGYVITRNLYNEIIETQSINLFKFYVKRFYRIFPALSFMLTCTLIISVFVISPILGHQNLAKNAIASILGFANATIMHTTGGYFDLPSETNPILNTWSLSVEEQFYFLLPIGLLLLYQIQVRSRHKFLVVHGIFLISVSSFLLMCLTSNNFFGGLLGFYSPLTRLWEFGLGVSVALVKPHYFIENQLLRSTFSWIGLIGIFITPLIVRTSSEFPTPIVLLPTISTAVLLLFGEGTMTGRLLSLKLLQAIGRVSFSIYLWHWPFIVYAKYLFPQKSHFMLLFAFFSLVPAVLSFMYIEKPMRTNPRYRSLSVFALIVGIPILVAVSLYFSSVHSFWSRNVINFQQSIAQVHAGRERGCFTDKSLSSLDISKCSWNAVEGEKVIYLVGDSNAEQFSESVIAAGKESGNTVVITGASACPFIGGYLDFPALSQEWNTRCRLFNTENFEFLKASAPAIVVLGNIDSYFYESSNGYFGIGADSSSVEYKSPKRELIYKNVFKQNLQELKRLGHEIILIQTIPNWVDGDWWEPYWCTTVKVMKGDCGSKMSRASAEARQGRIRDIISSIGNDVGVTVIDTWLDLCPGKTCFTQIDGKSVYRDGSHISVQKSFDFADQFLRVIRNLR